jgi:trans-2,3-dihydro-3-hydroxyanthranilate isomerase
MRLSETTFVFRRDQVTERARGVRTRIFTPQEELPFAGHPTLGTAWALRNEMGDEGSMVVLDLKVGRVPVVFSKEEGQLFAEMVQPDPTWGATHRRSDIAAAIGVEEAALDASAPIETVSTGVPFVIVPFRSLDTLRALRPDTAGMERYAAASGAGMFYLVSRETEDPRARLHARMIFYAGEDPATGSAAGTATAWMLRHGWIQPEERALIEQGLEISRPSQIFVRAGGTSETPRSIRVGGYCFGALRGELELPSSD